MLVQALLFFLNLVTLNFPFVFNETLEVLFNLLFCKEDVELSSLDSFGGGGGGGGAARTLGIAPELSRLQF